MKLLSNFSALTTFLTTSQIKDNVHVLRQTVYCISLRRSPGAFVTTGSSRLLSPAALLSPCSLFPPLLSNLVWTACCRCFSPGSLYSIHKLYQSNSYSKLDHPPYSDILPTNNHIVVCCSWWGRKGRFCIEWSSRSVPRRHCCCILFIYCCSQYDNATIHCSRPIELFPLPPSIFTLRVYPPQLRPCCCGSSARIPSVLFPLLSLCYLLHSNTKLLDHIRNDYVYPLCHNGQGFVPVQKSRWVVR